MTQAQALTILQTGANVFLTGEPGSGKTHTINAYIAWLRDRGIEPAITASTGIAATHIGGQTLHAWSGIGIKKALTDWDLEALLEREPLVKRVRATNVLIIDEVSMLDAEVLTMVDQAVRTLRGNNKPFGGIQVIFVGDFFQLPPVSKEGEARFAFESQAWINAAPLCCYLHEQHRQADGAFLSLLSALRSGDIQEEHRTLLQTRSTLEPGMLVTELYPHNADVDRINDEALATLSGSVRTYQMRSEGGNALVESLKRGCLSPETLSLKEGAAVMFTRNNFEAGYVNGTLGTVEGFTTEGMPIVITRSGKRIEATPEEWRIDDGMKTLAKIVQLPLRLAWAITVHKSQGMSLDAAVMDLSGAFAYGQGYVALSRVRTLEGLYLRRFNERSLQVHPLILDKDEAFRIESDTAADAFSAMPHDEWKSISSRFVAAVGGHEPTPGNKKETSGESRIEMLRKTHKNAYRPWSEEEDERLTQLFNEGVTPAKLSTVFGRQKGAIHMRLVKLGLIEPDDN